ncbi:MAG: YbaN family protein [Gemmataceae bacterium]|nr:YbaN family protein [Gemmataceae bacterium]
MGGATNHQTAGRSPVGPRARVEPRPAHGLRRFIYVALGLFFVGLAVLGVLLPVLPTTPFLLLASFFFVRSSSWLNAWLLRSRLFGGLLRDWQAHRAVRPRVKVTAVTCIPVVVASSVVLGGLALPLVLLLCGLGLIGLIVVLRLPVVRDPPPDPQGAAHHERVSVLSEPEG